MTYFFSFPHLDIYETSYMWFSAIPCLTCIAVGIIVSFLTKHQDPKKLNPDLISPALPKLFALWPKRVREYFETGMELGKDYVSSP